MYCAVGCDAGGQGFKLSRCHGTEDVLPQPRGLIGSQQI